MSLTGGDSIKAMLHDLVESFEHRIDKLALGQRKQFEFLMVPKDRSLDFENEYPELAPAGIYLLAPSISAVSHDGPPEEWDRDGTMASFSAGSEVAELRRFLQTAVDAEGRPRKRRGRRRREDGDTEPLPPPPPDSVARTFDPVVLKEVEGKEYFEILLKARATSRDYHRWSRGADERPYWKRCPVTTRTVEGDDVGVGEFLEPLARALKLAAEGDEEGIRKLIEGIKSDADSGGEKASKRAVKGTSDLRRYTINAAPALARAMALMLKEDGVAPGVVRGLMVSAAPKVAAEFERVTGRRAIGVSIHFDSNLPHWNIWHTGLEPVIYHVGGSERIRFRRTAMDLNASGNMVAWDRSARAFKRVGEDFKDISPATVQELAKAETRAMKRQNRPPGDFTLNRKADEVLEEAIRDLGFAGLVARGYREFVENEKKRYAAALAGRDPKEIEKMIGLLAPKAGETPLDATKRIMLERSEIEQALGCGKSDGMDVVAEAKRMACETEAANKAEREIRDILNPMHEECLADAAQRLVTAAELAEREGRVAEERNKQISTDLEAAGKKVEALENEIGPLRRLRSLVVGLLEAILAQSLKLPKSIEKTLKDIASLVGISFDIDHGKKPDENSGIGMQQ